jgi:hypothetical protein
MEVPFDFEDELFTFLHQKYVQRADERQKAMGLIYMEAETHDLAKEITRFARRLAAVS